MIEVRKATKEDKDSIYKILVADSKDQPPRSDENWDYLIEAGGMVVAEYEGRVIAYGIIDTRMQEELTDLYTLPEYQKKGAGKKVLEKLEQLAFEKGINPLTVYSKPGAVSFYEKAGYLQIQENVSAGGDLIGVWMKKSISSAKNN